MKKTRHYTMEVYEGSAGGFFWRIVAPNGRITGDGSEPYSSRTNANRAAKKMMEAFAAGKVDFKSA